MAECDDRDSRRAVRRTNAAGFPCDKRVDEFGFDANPNAPAATIHQFAGCGRVKAGQPLCLTGDSGTGKTHLLIALGTAADGDRDTGDPDSDVACDPRVGWATIIVMSRVLNSWRWSPERRP